MWFGRLGVTLLLASVAVLNAYWEEDFKVYSGTVDAFDVCASDNGEVFLVVSENNKLILNRSVDSGISWEADTVAELEFTPAFTRVISGNEDYVYVFYVTPDSVLKVVRCLFNLAGDVEEFTVAHHVAEDCFAITRDNKDPYGLYVVWLTGRSPFVDSLNFAKSIDFGVNWSYQTLKRNFYRPGQGVDIKFYPPRRLFIVWATCWGDSLYNNMEILLYGSDSLGEPGSWWGSTKRVTDNDSMDWNPKLAVGGDTSNPLIWVVYSHEQNNLGDVSLDFSVCDTGGLIEQGTLSDLAWGAVDFAGDLEKRWGCDSVDLVFVSLAYNAGVKVTSVTPREPYLWTPPTVVNEHEFVYINGATPKVVSVRGDMSGTVLIFYVANDGIYCDRQPYLGVFEEISSLPPRNVNCGIARRGAIFELPDCLKSYSYISLLDVAGRKVCIYRNPGRSVVIPSSAVRGVYFLYGDGKRAVKLIVQ